MRVERMHWKRLLFLLLIPVGAFLFYITAFSPALVEKFFSNGVYRWISQPLSLLTGLLPVSLMELGLLFLVVSILCLLLYTIFRVIRIKKGKLAALGNLLMLLLAAGSIIYFALILLWSLNYNRLPFADIASLEVRPSTVEELTQVCSSIIDRTNSLRSSINENGNGIMYIPGGYRNAFQRAYKGYEKASAKYPELGGQYGNPKGILFSHAMSYTGISGIFCPFTGEANVDVAMPDLMIPSTAMHEMAHQRGFAREDEANYIAWLTCRLHPDPDFQYSGSVLALIYSMNALYENDPDKYTELRKKYSEGLVRDLRDHSEFWQRYEGPVEKVADSVNNAYLKANRQKDGVRSYGRMVDLLIAEYRKGA
jgi:hypothetical protein